MKKKSGFLEPVAIPHLFGADGTQLEYVGEFKYHDDYQADAPEVGDDELSEATPTTSNPSRASSSAAPSRKRELSPTMTHLTGTL